jgi:hypothetical protein
MKKTLAGPERRIMIAAIGTATPKQKGFRAQSPRPSNNRVQLRTSARHEKDEPAVPVGKIETCVPQRQ